MLTDPKFDVIRKMSSNDLFDYGESSFEAHILVDEYYAALDKKNSEEIKKFFASYKC